jgi:glycosidase
LLARVSRAMKNKLSLVLWLVILCLLAPCAYPQGVGNPQQGPIVRKIDPPKWWINFTPQLQLMLSGEGFAGARIESRTKGLHVLNSEANANGHYLFVLLKISPLVEAGTMHLALQTPSGTTDISFPMLSRTSSRAFQGFSQDDVIYLIMPDRFADGDPSNDQPAGSTGRYDRSNPMAYHGGDLRGIRQHLQYLHDLGVTSLWLTPVWKNTDSDYHGYHVVDFYALDDHMGSMEEYQRLVTDAHKLGMKVLMDYVANHTGPRHPWANDPPAPTWFHGSPSHHLDPVYNFSGLVDPHASAREYRGTLEGWFAGRLPDLNPDNPELGMYLAQNAMWWMETAQLDGFRLDTFPYSSRQFWSGWLGHLQEIYPHANSVGEVADSDPSVTAFFEGGRKQFDGIDSGLPTVFDFPMENALRQVVIGGEPMQKIIDVLQRDELYPHPEMLVTFIGNHDHSRFISEKGSDAAKLKAAFSLLLTLRGIPQIYSGDEIGMPGGGDPDNRHDFPGGFPGDAQNAFVASGRTAEQQDIFNLVQSLLALRQAHPALRTGKQWHIGWDESYYAFLRELPQEKLLVVYNNSNSARDLKIPLTDTALQGTQNFESIFGHANAKVGGDSLLVTLESHSLAAFTVR